MRFFISFLSVNNLFLRVKKSVYSFLVSFLSVNNSFLRVNRLLRLSYLFTRFLKYFRNLQKYVYASVLHSVINTFFETTIFETNFEKTVKFSRYIRPPNFRGKFSIEASVFETSALEINSSYP